MGLLTHLKTGQKYAGPVGPWHPPIGDLEDAAGNNGSGRPSLNDPSMEYFSVDSTIQNFRYTYDNMGRLTQRTQENSQYETFQYDIMDRLTSFVQSNGISKPGSFTTTYDAQGNILSNTLAGTYSYESDKPHAVTKVTPSTNFPNAISAADCETDYNVFNQPSRIAEGNVEILLEYGADNQRVKAVFKNHGHILRTHYYISANYEKEVDSHGMETHYNYIYGSTGLAAICVRRNSVDSMYYVHPDRLGSYTHITNANKQIIRNLHFDPWGNVKSDTNWRTFDSTTLSGKLAGSFRFSRGFTGHEHYADLKIINMNGRLYDPVIARFFSPDNFVQAPDFTQSYNRYSYCLNNPLQWVDPSGELLWEPDKQALEEGRGIRFIAQEGDNLRTFSVQTGLDYDYLKSLYGDMVFEAGQSYSFDKIDKVKDINDAIALMNNADYNCANFAMFSNGIFQEPAFVNDDGTSSLDNAASMIDSRFSNVSAAGSCIGDVVTFGYTEWAMRRENNFQDVSELYTPKYTDTPGHYGVVLLKSKDGMSVQIIIEKPNSHAIRLNDYTNYQSDFFTPRPKTNGTTPFYKLR